MENLERGRQQHNKQNQTEQPKQTVTNRKDANKRVKQKHAEEKVDKVARADPECKGVAGEIIGVRRSRRKRKKKERI